MESFDIHEDQTEEDHRPEEKHCTNEYDVPGDVSAEEEDGEEDEAVAEDLEKFKASIRGISKRFRLIKRIGEGTFSTVYKAEDLHYYAYHNHWDWHANDHLKWASPPLKRRRTGEVGSSSAENTSQRSWKRIPRYVAIKKIYVTSSPIRIQNELELLHDLTGCRDEYFREMLVPDIRDYFHSLFTALAAVHSHGILHRDIKPTNFLYDIPRRRGVLVDFGLAEREGTEPSWCLCEELQYVRRRKIEASQAVQQPPAIGYPKDDTRPSRRANRAGTRGFRAPEVLFKCPNQTTKIDIWSAGVILLTILSRRFPFFNSIDDVEATIEIATIFGRRRMQACALLHGTVFETDIPTIGERGFGFEKIVRWSTGRSKPKKQQQSQSQSQSQQEEAEAAEAAAAAEADPDHEAFIDLLPGELDAINFLQLCLELDPSRRISAEDALEHSFFQDLDDDMVESEEREDEVEGVAEMIPPGDEDGGDAAAAAAATAEKHHEEGQSGEKRRHAEEEEEQKEQEEGELDNEMQLCVE